MTKDKMIELGGKEWVKGGIDRVYIDADIFNDIMGTSLGDRNNKFFFDCKKNALMRSYKGKMPKIEIQY